MSFIANSKEWLINQLVKLQFGGLFNTQNIL